MSSTSATTKETFWAHVPYLRAIFCAHDPVVIHETRIPSEAENVAHLGLRPNTWCSLVEKHVVVLKCRKCNHLIERVHKTARV